MYRDDFADQVSGAGYDIVAVTPCSSIGHTCRYSNNRSHAAVELHEDELRPRRRPNLLGSSSFSSCRCVLKHRVQRSCACIERFMEIICRAGANSLAAI